MGPFCATDPSTHYCRRYHEQRLRYVDFSILRFSQRNIIENNTLLCIFTIMNYCFDQHATCVRLGTWSKFALSLLYTLWMNNSSNGSFMQPNTSFVCVITLKRREINSNHSDNVENCRWLLSCKSPHMFLIFATRKCGIHAFWVHRLKMHTCCVNENVVRAQKCRITFLNLFICEKK